MSPHRISERIVTTRLQWVRDLVQGIRTLPTTDPDSFLSDPKNVWAAESCLRRALEALLDLGRHILARGFGDGVAEYREVAVRSLSRGILSAGESSLLARMAGYRNRLVHFYHEVGPEELLEICTQHLPEIEELAEAYRKWIEGHPDQLDRGM